MREGGREWSNFRRPNALFPFSSHPSVSCPTDFFMAAAAAAGVSGQKMWGNGMKGEDDDGKVICGKTVERERDIYFFWALKRGSKKSDPFRSCECLSLMVMSQIRICQLTLLFPSYGIVQHPILAAFEVYILGIGHLCQVSLLSRQLCNAGGSSDRNKAMGSQMKRIRKLEGREGKGREGGEAV